MTTVTAMSLAARTSANVITLSGEMPHHILGGTYKPTAVTLQVANEPAQIDNDPGPAGDIVLQIEDDGPTPIDKPVIEDFDLA